jgi:class 3 adenylate cyclase
LARALVPAGGGPTASTVVTDTLSLVFVEVADVTLHGPIVRHQIQAWRGSEASSAGEATLATFASVGRALGFATALQRDLMVARVGVHTGETALGVGGEPVGRHVTLAARVAGLAAEGQILTSLVVRRIAAGRDDLRFSPPMTAELEGFDDERLVYELLWRD